MYNWNVLGIILGRSMRIAITKRKLRQLSSPKFMLWTFVHSERLAIENYGIFRSYTSNWETKQSAQLQGIGGIGECWTRFYRILESWFLIPAITHEVMLRKCPVLFPCLPWRRPPGIARQPLAQPWGMAYWEWEAWPGEYQWTHRTLQDWSPFSGHPMFGGQQNIEPPGLISSFNRFTSSSARVRSALAGHPENALKSASDPG